MTIKEAQELIEAWGAKNHSVGGDSDLSLMASLTEEVGELARVLAGRHDGVENAKDAIEDELGDILWVVLSIAERTGVDLTDALIKNLEKKSTLGA